MNAFPGNIGKALLGCEDKANSPAHQDRKVKFLERFFEQTKA